MPCGTCLGAPCVKCLLVSFVLGHPIATTCHRSTPTQARSPQQQQQQQQQNTPPPRKQYPQTTYRIHPPPDSQGIQLYSKYFPHDTQRRQGHSLPSEGPLTASGSYSRL
ncbi:unnamed protein product [Ectocarpus fasciculatus]